MGFFNVRINAYINPPLTEWTPPMFVVTVTFTLNAGKADQFLPLISQNAAQSLAVEPGCLTFDVCTDPQSADTVFLYEVYTDEAAFGAHLTSAHFKTFDTASADMVSSKEVRLFRKVTS